MHVGLDKDFHLEKRGHPAFDVTNIDGLMRRLEEHGVPFEEVFNMPGARRFYTYAFFGHRMEFLEWHDKPESLMTEAEKAVQG